MTIARERGDRGRPREQRRREAIREMRALVDSFAARPVVFQDPRLGFGCGFCPAISPLDTALADPANHAEDCLWRQARDYVKRHPQ